MALFEDVMKGGSLPGIAVALGAALLAPTVVPAVGRAIRPVAKTALKAGIVLYRNTVAGVGEAFGDIVDEAQRELTAERGTGSSAGRTTGSSVG
jgi:hypothetical protein